MVKPPLHADDLQQQVAQHSLGWLLGGNLVGLWMAALLLWPDLGRLVAPLTYGRWTTVHLNIQLYGWCSVPLLGLLFRMYLPRADARGGALALQAWSGALVFSAMAWLAGQVSGKPFMEWHGLTRWVMPAAMAVLAGVLITGYVRRLREQSEATLVVTLKGAALLVLSAVPLVLAWAADPKLYPVINPDSGGATGGSLLGSTLGIIVMFLAFPLVTSLPRLRSSRWLIGSWILLAAHYGWFFALDHGHRSHHETSQIVALFSLLIWWPVLVRYLKLFAWPEGSRLWLAAFAIWGALLLGTALFTFLPGVLDRWKFTNALVAHTHIAMAGMLSCFLMLVLITLDRPGRLARTLATRSTFVLWHGSAYVLCSVLLWIGVLEAHQPALVYFSHHSSQLAYLVRLLAGSGMTLAVLSWYRSLTTKDAP